MSRNSEALLCPHAQLVRQLFVRLVIECIFLPTEARAAPHWEEARRALAVSAPVPAAALTEALIAAASHRNEGLHQLALAEASVLPPSTLVHLGWVVRRIARPDGYISAAGQEVCLMLYTVAPS